MSKFEAFRRAAAEIGDATSDEISAGSDVRVRVFPNLRHELRQDLGFDSDAARRVIRDRTQRDLLHKADLLAGEPDFSAGKNTWSMVSQHE